MGKHLDVAANSPFQVTQLADNAAKHILFLQKLHASGVTLREEPALAKSMERDLNLWLPLVAAISKTSTTTKIIPPADIAWLWHCHRLAPVQYVAYCQKKFGKIVESTSPFDCQTNNNVARNPTSWSLAAIATLMEEKDSEQQTQKLWKSMYPNEPFFFVYLQQDDGDHEEEEHQGNDKKTSKNRATSLCSANKSALVEQLDGFDLLGSSNRQKLFLWYVSHPIFQDRKYLEDGVRNYNKFLALKHESKEDKAVPLVPTYQIDLVWHTHIATSIGQYNEHCIKIRGETFYHDDSMDDRSPGGLLDTSFSLTGKRWKEVYQEDYEVEGAMYNGSPPSFYFSSSWVLSKSRGSSSSTMKETEDDSISNASPNLEDGSRWKTLSSTNGTFIKVPSGSLETIRVTCPKMDGYILGIHDAGGVGYYSFETKEAYEILYKRLKIQEAREESVLATLKCTGLVCCLPKNRPEVKQWKQRLVDTIGMVAYVDRRRKSRGPCARIDESSVKTTRRQLLQSHHIDLDEEQKSYPYVPGYWGTGDGGDMDDVHMNNGSRACDAYVDNVILSGAAGCGGAALWYVPSFSL